MTEEKYIPLKDIEKVMYMHYAEHGRFISLPDAVHVLLNRPDCVFAESEGIFPQRGLGMSDEDYVSCFNAAAIPASRFLDYPQSSDWRELQYRHLRFNEYIRIYKHACCNLSNMQMHSHKHLEVIYVFRGSAQVQFDKKSEQLKSGDVCLIGPETMHGVTILNPNDLVLNMILSKRAFESLLLQFSQEGDLLTLYLQNMLYNNADCSHLLIHTSNSPMLKACVKSATCAAFSAQYYSYSAAVSWLSLFLGEIFQEYHTLADLNRERTLNVQSDYIMLIQYIQDNFLTITLASLAKTFNYNKTYLSRLIVRIMGKNLSEIIVDLKLEKACSYLSETNLKIQNISNLCGFDNQNYFAKVFKEKYGISPSVYRKKTAA